MTYRIFECHYIEAGIWRQVYNFYMSNHNFLKQTFKCSKSIFARNKKFNANSALFFKLLRNMYEILLF